MTKAKQVEKSTEDENNDVVDVSSTENTVQEDSSESDRNKPTEESDDAESQFSKQIMSYLDTVRDGFHKTLSVPLKPLMSPAKFSQIPNYETKDNEYLAVSLVNEDYNDKIMIDIRTSVIMSPLFGNMDKPLTVVSQHSTTIDRTVLDPDYSMTVDELTDYCLNYVKTIVYRSYID